MTFIAFCFDFYNNAMHCINRVCIRPISHCLHLYRVSNAEAKLQQNVLLYQPFCGEVVC